jgi:hypothetical protein
LCELFGRGLFAENGDGWVARHEFNQQCYERDDGPNNQQQNYHAAQTAEQLIAKLCAHRGA